MIGAASLSGSSLLNAAMSKTDKLLPIVDTHQHLVDFKRFGAGWANPPVSGNFGIHEYEKAIKGLNIVKAVYMEVAVAPENRYEEALYAIELCKDQSNPTVAAIIKADFYSDNFENYMLKFKGSPYVKGIRIGFRSNESLVESSTVDKIRFLGDMNMSVDFIVSPAWFPNMAKLIRSCPGTQFQADHCGNADPKAFLEQKSLVEKPDHNADEWISGIKEIALEKNVVCKISGLVSRMSGYPLSAETLAPAINHCLDIFGADRVMFASDWPWSLKGATISTWVNLLKEVVKSRPLADQKKLFHDNAIQHYKI